MTYSWINQSPAARFVLFLCPEPLKEPVHLPPWIQNCWLHGNRKKWSLSRKCVVCRRSWQKVTQRERSLSPGAECSATGWEEGGVNVIIRGKQTITSPPLPLQLCQSVAPSLALSLQSKGEQREWRRRVREGREREARQALLIHRLQNKVRCACVCVSLSPC